MNRFASRVGVLVTIGLSASAASAGLSGMMVQLNSESQGGVFGDSFQAGPYVQVGAGVEWSGMEDIYVLDDPFNPIYGGVAEWELDIGDDYVELTITADLLDLSGSDYDWEVFYLLPAAFNGLVMGFDTAFPEIQSASISFGGVAPTGHIGEWNLWADTLPPVEAMVDDLWQAPDDPARVWVDSGNTLMLDHQGMAWTYAEDGGVQVMSMRADLTFVPAPSALALLGLMGLQSRRRRR